MRFWAVGFFNVGFWSQNFWAPAGLVTTTPQQPLAPSQQAFFTVQAGQTTGGPSGSGAPYTVGSN